eukprot:12882779-Prorocentrum_lima.AAC.1
MAGRMVEQPLLTHTLAGSMVEQPPPSERNAAPTTHTPSKRGQSRTPLRELERWRATANPQRWRA